VNIPGGAVANLLLRLEKPEAKNRLATISE